MVSFYLHLPFCARRCGYCDFNTYLPTQLPRTSPNDWLSAVRAEIALAADRLGTADPVETIFFGGGTPTLFGADLLNQALEILKSQFDLSDDIEVTVEANPETVTKQLLDELLAGGVTRLSLGMQSLDLDVLDRLDRVHRPGQALRSVELAHSQGFRDVNLDLIYGTPGESLDSWQQTLAMALSSQPEHVSCYALIVEPGTPLARRIEAGELPPPDDDLMADQYTLADEVLSAAGLSWYELSNWAQPDHQCRHNLVYWLSGNWWGVGPGAHSHVNGRRWWNHRSPTAWAAALAKGQSPEAGHEIVDQTMSHQERLLLELRLAAGLPLNALTASESARLPSLVEGLAEVRGDRLVLSLPGRLVADRFTRDLLD